MFRERGARFHSSALAAYRKLPFDVTSLKQPRKPAAGGRPDDPVADEILKAIRRMLRKTAEHSRDLSRRAGLTTPQVLCMRAIDGAAKDEEVTVVQVANAIQLSPATVSRLLDRLEQAGLVVRQRISRDRRRVCLSLTAEGRRQIRRLPTPLHEEFLQRLKKLSKRKQQAMLRSLEEIVAMMGASDLDAAPMLTPGVDVKPPANQTRMRRQSART